MEAARFGFNQPGLSPEFKFDPTDDDLVTHYLLPRALGLPGPHEHAVIEADPGGLPPWEVLEAHGIDMFQQFLLFQMEQQCWQAGDPSNGGEGYSGGGGGEEQQQQQQQAGCVFCGGGYDAGSDHGSDVGTGSTISYCGAAA